ncbi:6-phosphogluconolactonase [Paucilactobacillus sp. N302-9]
MIEHKENDLVIRQYEHRTEMGIDAAKRVAAKMREVIERKGKVRMIFASAPSQDDVLAALAKEKLDWSRVEGFHMDEYRGLAPDDTRLFSYYIKQHLFDVVGMTNYHVISSMGEKQQVIDEYTKLLTAEPIDICCMGIGENGHIAFNEPAYADFNDPVSIKEITLDDVDRQQQVNDECFAKIEDVPKTALTLTVPVLTNVEQVCCVVPGPTKKAILKKLIASPVTTDIPSSILKRHSDCIVYTDQELFEESGR